MGEFVNLLNAAGTAFVALGGHLVTITSEAENDFVFRLTDDDTYWFHSLNWRGPWIGTLQPPGSEEPAGGWSWVTGEPFTYARWDAQQPNNFNGTPENRLVFGNQRSRIPTGTMSSRISRKWCPSSWNGTDPNPPQSSGRISEGSITTSRTTIWPCTLAWEPPG